MASPPSQAAESSAAHASTNADHSSASNDNDRSPNHGSRRPDYRGGPKEPYQKPFPMGMHPAVLPVPAFGMQNGFRGSIMPGDGMMAGMGMPNIVSGPGMMIPFHPGIRMMPGPVPMPMPGPHGFPDHLMGRQFPRPFMMGHHPQQHNNVPIVNAGMDGHYHHHHHHHQGRTENGNHRREYSSGSGGSNASAELRSSTSGVSVQEMKELEDLLSKLNPLAKEFVPPGTEDGSSGESSLPRQGSQGAKGKKKNGLLGGKKRGGRSGRAHREDSIKRTVYVSDIDQSVTEEQLASLFLTCGQVVDCRICGDPNSVLRFAFVEFVDEEGARNALSLAGTVLGYYPVRVLPSKTAIIPVNPTFLPRNEDDRDLCSRTVYCANIDKKVTQADVKLFFESLCGEVGRLRLLGDFHHSTRIAFVEFIHAESAMAALNCSGAILGSLPIRVSPSKTPVRPRSPHPHHNR